MVVVEEDGLNRREGGGVGANQAIGFVGAARVDGLGSVALVDGGPEHGLAFDFTAELLGASSIQHGDEEVRLAVGRVNLCGSSVDFAGAAHVAHVLVAHAQVTVGTILTVVVRSIRSLIEEGGGFAPLLILEELDTQAVGSLRAGFQFVEAYGGVEEELRFRAVLLIEDGGDALEEHDVIRSLGHLGAEHLDQVFAGGVGLEQVVEVALHTFINCDGLGVLGKTLSNLVVGVEEGFHTAVHDIDNYYPIG